jgi:hypothetical protein
MSSGQSIGLVAGDHRPLSGPQADEETVLLRQLMDAWSELGHPATVSDAAETAYAGLAPLLKALLDDLPGDKNSKKRALGNLLRDYRGRVLDRRKLDRTDNKRPKWRVVNMDARGKGPIRRAEASSGHVGTGSARRAGVVRAARRSGLPGRMSLNHHLPHATCGLRLAVWPAVLPFVSCRRWTWRRRGRENTPHAHSSRCRSTLLHKRRTRQYLTRERPESRYRTRTALVSLNLAVQAPRRRFRANQQSVRVWPSHVSRPGGANKSLLRSPTRCVRSTTSAMGGSSRQSVGLVVRDHRPTGIRAGSGAVRRFPAQLTRRPLGKSEENRPVVGPRGQPHLLKLRPSPPQHLIGLIFSPQQSDNELA